MKRFLLTIFWAFGLNSISMVQAQLNLIPAPEWYELRPGTCRITPESFTECSTKLQQLELLSDEWFQQYFGFTLRHHPLPRTKSEAFSSITRIRLSQTEADSSSAFQIHCTRAGIYISGGGAGLIHGLSTLVQLAKKKPGSKEVVVPCFQLRDRPAFSYRGMHLDVSRHFFPVEEVKRYIDYLAVYRFNYFHWHLTDDQGWRLEIKKYPRLTEVGAWRDGTIVGAYPGTGNDQLRHGGYYSQQDVHEIITYAGRRGITVIPEIELPGHASAAIAAYPELSCFPNEPTIVPKETVWAGPGTGKQVAQSWGVFEDVLCPTEYTFQFMQDVLQEVIELFPSPYIHIGGDECPKSAWKRSAFCQQLMREMHLPDEEALQSYFIRRIGRFLNSKGKTLVGWDEILEGGLAPDAVVMSWRGESGGIAAARLQHRVIMTPGTPLYLNHAQNRIEDSVTQGGYNSLEAVYRYHPLPASLETTYHRYILGAQGNLWSEYIGNRAKMDYQLFPRIAALSEALWTRDGQKDFQEFKRRLIRHQDSFLLPLQIHGNNSWMQPKARIRCTEGSGKTYWVLEPELPDGIVMNFNNYDTVWSYHGPEALKTSGTFFAYDPKGRYRIRQDFRVHDAVGRRITIQPEPQAPYAGRGKMTLLDGEAGSGGLNEPDNWLGYQGHTLTVKMDLGDTLKLKQIQIHSLHQPESWIYAPSKIMIQTSTDTAHTQFESVQYCSIPKKSGNISLLLPVPVTTRYLYLTIVPAATIPAGQPGAGSAPWLFLSEIEVNRAATSNH